MYISPVKKCVPCSATVAQYCSLTSCPASMSGLLCGVRISSLKGCV